MSKITFHELLGMIKTKTQPQKVRINGTNFWWDEIYDSYTSGDGLYLTFWMHYSMSDEKLANKECIEIEEQEQEELKEKSNAEIYVDFLEHLLESAIAMITKENSKGETDIYLIGRRDGLKSAYTNVMKMILDFKEENADDSSNTNGNAY